MIIDELRQYKAYCKAKCLKACEFKNLNEFLNNKFYKLNLKKLSKPKTLIINSSGYGIYYYLKNKEEFKNGNR